MTKACKANGGPWWGVAKDNDNKKFSVIGPIEDDRPMINKVNAKHTENKDFTCEAIETSVWTRKQVIDYWENQGYELVDTEDLYKA